MISRPPSKEQGIVAVAIQLIRLDIYIGKRVLGHNYSCRKQAVPHHGRREQRTHTAGVWNNDEEPNGNWVTQDSRLNACYPHAVQHALYRPVVDQGIMAASDYGCNEMRR